MTVEPHGEIVQHLIMERPRRAKSESVTTRWIDIQRAVVTLTAHFRIIGHAISHWGHHTVIICCKNDGRWRQVAHYGILIRELFHQFLVFLSLFSQEVHTRALMRLALIHRDYRIKKDGEIRTTVVLTMRRNGRSQMSTSRKAHDTHILRINIPHLCRIPDCTDSLLSVAHRNTPITIWHTIGEHKKSDALIIKVRRPVVPLVLYGQMGIATTRTVHDSTSRGILRQISNHIGFAVGGNIYCKSLCCLRLHGHCRQRQEKHHEFAHCCKVVWFLGHKGTNK